ncbi:hypothetical protein [Falsiroseomonas oryzae]|uniref:hypothetical protein n=1 Tax=Falsiroseomonas oryzae TaxID=2766473 RepID=UPI0022EAA359|nr:hypothetical protein [Roseomonas sp. MO-31]
MAAASLVTVTLARAWEPGDAASETGRIDFAIALDPQGHPDVQAWLDDPAPWPAVRVRPDGPPQQGDVAHDEEGWQIRFFTEEDRDTPPHRICHIDGGLRPGEVLTLRAPDGEEAAWRVVGVSPRTA